MTIQPAVVGARGCNGVVLLLCLLVACRGPDTAARSALGGLVPVPRDAVIVPRDTTARPAREEDRALLKGWKKRLTGASEAVRIGTEDGPQETQLGRVRSMYARDGRLYAVDDILQTVRIFGNDGAYAADLARAGDGPLEMRWLRASATVPAGGIVIADASKLKVFKLSDSGAASLQATIFPRAAPQGICSIGQQVFVRITTPRLPQLIDAVRLEDGSQTLFGESLPGPDVYTRATLSEGRIVCTRDPPRVVVTFDAVPLVVAYDTSGSQVWSTYLADVRPGIWERIMLEGREGFRRNKTEGDDLTLNVTELPPDAIAIQILSVGPADANGRREGKRMDTYLLSAATGAGAYIGATMLPIGAADEGGFWYVLQTSAGFQQLIRMRYLELVEPASDSHRDFAVRIP